MTETPFLILHKVRGEPAFDIAIQLQIGDELGWIIPTSGHRAYPASWCRLDFMTNQTIDDLYTSISRDFGNPWHNLRDHYQVVAEAPTFGPKKSLSSLLGIIRAPLRMRRLT